MDETTERLLLVGAGEMLAATCARAAAEAGFALARADDAAAALQAADHAPPGAILLDGENPDAEAMFHQLKRDGHIADAVFILLARRRSADEPPAEAGKPGDANIEADDCLARPLHMAEFRVRVGTTLKLATLKAEIRRARRALLQTPSGIAEPAAAYFARPAAPKEIGGCRLTEKLQGGSIADSYRGWHVTLEREVLVKLFSRHLGQWQPAQLQRFLRGARAAARFEHPNLAPVINAGVEGDYYYVIRPFIAGIPLDEILARRGRLLEAEALAMARGVAAGLAAAHELGVLHRDVKPANIIIGRSGAPKVIDFGLAHWLGAPSVSSTGEIIGTPNYMPPEQVDGDILDARADVYALGATLYHSLVGHPPFEAPTLLQLLRRQIEDTPAPPATLCPEISAATSELAMRMLSKSRDERPASMEKIIAALASPPQAG